MRDRRLPPGMIGELRNRIPVKVPTGELGWLTPVRATAGDASSFIFRCRCGTQVTRKAKDVRKNVRMGHTPKCSQNCTGKPAEVGAERA